jgi:predicted transposase/invertase (TIGR01784 family)
MVAERNPQIQKAAVKLRVMSADERARDMFERRIKGERDYRMNMKEATRIGEERGIEKGLEKGIEQGRIEVLTITVANLLKMNLTKDQIAKATGLSLDEIDKICLS